MPYMLVCLHHNNFYRQVLCLRTFGRELETSNESTDFPFFYCSCLFLSSIFWVYTLLICSLKLQGHLVPNSGSLVSFVLCQWHMEFSHVRTNISLIKSHQDQIRGT